MARKEYSYVAKVFCLFEGSEGGGLAPDRRKYIHLIEQHSCHYVPFSTKNC